MQNELANFRLLMLPKINTLTLSNASVAYTTKQCGCSSEGMEENLHGSRMPFMIDGSVQACVT